ncbi:MAG: DNA polymerase III subunit gamma/tau [Candidatus Sumerlaeota bacterium]|nr:DNA polymerase III subunit gamma/tau [Candidatus Sumerlaeota bacterium]
MSNDELELGLEPAASQRPDFVVSARKYRPQTFEDLTGQETVARALGKAIQENRVPHALLFSGPRGVGKTTTARILAKALNCKHGPTPTPCGQCEHCIGITNGSDLDVVEIDGASNTGVDNIRELIERVNYASFAADWKVYIIDEVHMLSQGAFNALLKTLEEPPPRVIFVFATTEPRKVPETIRSRCTWYQFGRISTRNIAARLDYVANQEHLKIAEKEREEILLVIASGAEGGMRDALVTLDQLAALCEGEITLSETRRLLGLVEHGLLADIFAWLISRDTKALLEKVNDLASAGQDFERLVKTFCQFLRDVMIVRSLGKNSGLVDATGERLEAMAQLGAKASQEQLLQFTRTFLDLEAEMKTAAQQRILLEYTFIKLTVLDAVTPLDQMIKRLEALESGAGRSGTRAEPSAPAAAKAPARSVAPPSASAAHFAAAPVPDSSVTARVAADSAAQDYAAPNSSGALPNAHIVHKCDLSDLNGVWQLLLTVMNERKRTLVASLRLCTPARVEGGSLILALPKTEQALYDKSQIEWTESRKALRHALKEICGRELEVKVELVEANAAVSAGAAGTTATTATTTMTERKQGTAARTAPAPAPQKAGIGQPAATLRDEGAIRSSASGAPPAARAASPAQSPVKAAKAVGFGDREPDWEGSSEEGGMMDDGGWTSSNDAPVSQEETAPPSDQDMFSPSKAPATPVAAAIAAPRPAGPYTRPTLSAREQEKLARASANPKERLERMKKDSSEFARAVDLIVSSFNGFVTHVDGQPIR